MTRRARWRPGRSEVTTRDVLRRMDAMTPGQIALGLALAGAVAGTALVLMPLATAPDQAAALPGAAAPVAPAAELALQGQGPAASPSVGRPEMPPAAAAPAIDAAAAVAPRFDVARVGARGMLVAAGRAAPQAEVVLLEGGREIGRSRADARGEWVILPQAPLAAGARELSLQARRPGGETVPGREVVVVLVPEAAPSGPRP